MGLFETISFALIAGGLIAFYAISKMLVRSKSTSYGQREGDARKLNRHERKIFKMARELYEQGKYEAAAQFLESIDMKREAIEMLERHGLIHEAASVLLRMQLPERAGAIYGRHSKWKEAYRCFLQAQKFKEAGICAWNSGEIEASADLFLKANMKKEAADAFFESGKLQNAARLYFDIGQHERALELYKELGSKTPDLGTLTFDINELRFLEESVSSGYSDPMICDILGQNDKLASAVLALIHSEKMKAAAESYARSTKDIGPELMSKIDYSNNSALRLAELFDQLSNFMYAGLVFQKLGKFELAGHSFAKAEEYDRAFECYERAGNKELATEMRIQAASTGKKKTRPMGTPITQSSPQMPSHQPPSIDIDSITKGISSGANKKLEAENSFPPVSEESYEKKPDVVPAFAAGEKTGIFELDIGENNKETPSTQSEEGEVSKTDVENSTAPISLNLTIDMEDESLENKAEKLGLPKAS